MKSILAILFIGALSLHSCKKDDCVCTTRVYVDGTFTNETEVDIGAKNTESIETTCNNLNNTITVDSNTVTGNIHETRYIDCHLE